MMASRRLDLLKAEAYNVYIYILIYLRIRV